MRNLDLSKTPDAHRSTVTLRYLPFFLILLIAALLIALPSELSGWPFAALVVALFLIAVGIWDLFQGKHSLRRNYPVIGHIRRLFEGIRPEIRQYLIESDRDDVPFSREVRSLAYQRAKRAEELMPFGTEVDVYANKYSWINHSISPAKTQDTDFRLKVGGPHCKQPYESSLLNISALSFGSLGGNAIQALNRGAKIGNFAHDTGEGSISRHHRKFGGDLIWEIGTGYFGCRTDDGHFDPARFEEQAADTQVKMIEVKLSQGAKPGKGGILPSSKVTDEISEARGVPIYSDCISPAGHSAFSTPIEMMEFLAKLRDLSGGKPVGFKLCVGQPSEFMGLVKAMLETQITPDFIVVDGKEGGTGAAPLEFLNRMGTPLEDGLVFVRNCLIGAGLRDQVKIAASGKLVTAFSMAKAIALGADWCNSGRGFMFALGCIQAQSCHTNHCPTGIATHDSLRERALVVDDKAERVAYFHKNTMKALGAVANAAGFEHPGDISPDHIQVRLETGDVGSLLETKAWLENNELVDGTLNSFYAEAWGRASAARF